jgi:hypothetical protein
MLNQAQSYDEVLENGVIVSRILTSLFSWRLFSQFHTPTALPAENDSLVSIR